VLADNNIEVRLSDRWYGTVEIKYGGQWGQVCNTNFDDIDASVVCHQLGYTDGYVSTRATRKGSGYVRMDNINCTGTEASILECQHNGYWGAVGRSTQCNNAVVRCNTTSKYLNQTRRLLLCPVCKCSRQSLAKSIQCASNSVNELYDVYPCLMLTYFY